MFASIKEKTNQKIQLIPLKMIDIDDAFFRMTFCPDLSSLKTSVDNIGLINPVILRGEESYQIVSGFRRILVAQSLEWEEIAARAFAPEELHLGEGFGLNFYENVGTRYFNLIEASMVVTGFVEKCNQSQNQVKEKILPLLGFQPGTKVFQELYSLKGLLNEWKELVLKKEISLPNASKISGFSSLDQEILYAAVSGLKLGENKMRECLEMIEEVGKRDEISVKELFSSEPFRSLEQDANLNLTEKTEQFRKSLKARRYPELTRLQEKFNEHRKKLSFPPQISLTAPDFFEGNKLRMNFEFRSFEELKSILEKLGKAAEDEALKILLGML